MEFLIGSDIIDKVRLDSYLSDKLEDMSRSHIQGLIRSGNITVNGNKVKPGYIVSSGDRIDIDIPEPEKTDIVPEDIALDIVYEDDDVILVNKPKGMVVHPANGHYSGTLVNALLFHCRDSLSGINGEMRPGIVHRIDMDTTGIVIACKNDRAHNMIAAQLAEHSIERKYIALVYGGFNKLSGTVDEPIGRSRKDRKQMSVVKDTEGRRAVTHYKVLRSFYGINGSPDLSLIECRLETGRTHQIRVHMSYISHPLAGDEVYGIRKDPLKGNGQYLHAAVLGFTHPTTGERMHFEAPLPEYFEKTLSKLKEK